MPTLRPVRGTHDLLPEDNRRHRRVIETFRDIAERFAFGEIATPIFEFAEVFKRTLGETSDIVTKEMYTFTDRGGDLITLRPEYTAGIARAFISGGLQQQLPLKFYGHGPMFRYERPQKGRQRQFHQLDAEILGVAEPLADIEVIALGATLLEALGMADVTELELNTLGDPESRAAYRAALVDYFEGHRDGLSEDSLRRLDRNPLRILDSKDEGDRAVVVDAPLMGDYLNAASADMFGAVRAGLDRLGIAYRLNPRLVRGLDYYTHTAFEFTTRKLGAQGAVIAGGRYDGLIDAGHRFGGRHRAIGLAACRAARGAPAGRGHSGRRRGRGRDARTHAPAAQGGLHGRSGLSRQCLAAHEAGQPPARPRGAVARRRRTRARRGHVARSRFGRANRGAPRGARGPARALSLVPP